MTKAIKTKTGDGLVPKGGTQRLDVVKRDDEPLGRTLPRVSLDPLARHACIAVSFAGQIFGDDRQPSLMETAAVLGEELGKAAKGDMTIASRILAAQAISLDALFTEMSRRAGANLGGYPDAADRYMRLAFKAQSNCRSTLEALARLHQPREQTVRHVHVNDGGQAVIADQFHHHTGGTK